MTLAISVATPAFGLHVSDRLVSKGGAPHDALANKTVVFRATDGLVAFGYTGAAFLEQIPTDTWVADVLSGGSCAHAQGSIIHGRFPIRDLGSSLASLSQRLRAGRIFEVLGGEVCATGWQWNAKRTRTFARPVLWLLHRGSGQLRWTQLMPRHLPERRTQFRIYRIGDWPLADDIWADLVETIGAAGPDWEAAETLLVDAIRQSSHSRPGTIGSHCMSVVVRPSGFPNAHVRFHPSVPHIGMAFDQEVGVAYTPWMVAPDAIHAPSISVGGLICEQGMLSYSIEAPEVPDGQVLKGAFQSQERPSS